MQQPWLGWGLRACGQVPQEAHELAYAHIAQALTHAHTSLADAAALKGTWHAQKHTLTYTQHTVLHAHTL